MLDFNLYRNKKVLITGHTGFKGAWLSEWLCQIGAEVQGFAFPAEEPSLFHSLKLEERMTSHTGDLRNFSEIYKVIENFSPDFIFHMAAQALVRPSYDEPDVTYMTNVMGTVHVFESARRLQQPVVIVNVTSDKCYENDDRIQSFSEGDRLGGFDPYSSSKACAELVTHSYRNSFFKGSSIRLASARAGNVIGGGDFAKDRLIPDFVRSVLGQSSMEIRNPSAVRPWQHVLEPLSGYLQLGQKVYSDGESFCEAWNFGPPSESCVTVAQVIERLKNQIPQADVRLADVTGQPHEAHYLEINPEKAKTKLNWQPRLNLDDAVAWTATWYQGFLDKGDLQKLTREQITAYCQKEGI